MQVRLGGMYRLGDGVEKNYKKAYEFFEKASNQGDISGKLELARLLYLGRGVDQNFKKSFQLNKEAARSGSSKGQYNIAMMYYFGEGVSKDLKKSKQWLNKIINDPKAESSVKKHAKRVLDNLEF